MKLVIGGSISGLYAATRLAEKGVKTLVLEKNGIPSKRTLIITPEVLRFLTIPEDIILNRIRGFEIFLNGKRLFVPLKHPDIVIERRDLIKYLEMLATKRGVSILKEAVFRDVSEDKNGWVVEYQHRENDRREILQCDVIISADGIRSRVREIFFKSRHGHLYLVQAKVPMPEDYRRDISRIWIDRRFSEDFIWFIPQDKRFGVCGLCSERADARERLDAFLNESGLEPLEYESGIVPVYNPGFFPYKRVGKREIFLVGDAALQVKMSTVGGVFAGLWGAFCATESLTENLPFTKFYKELKRELDIHYYIRRVLVRLEYHDYHWFMRLSEDLKHIFYDVPRDRMREIFLKILLKKPSLILLGLKGLLKYPIITPRRCDGQ